MIKFLCSCVALLTLFVTVESLVCDTCDVNILGSCLGSSPQTCTGDQNACYNGVARFTSTLLPIYARGCIQSSECKNETKTILTVNVTITMSCCPTDHCNGAASIQLPVTTALGAALVAIWSRWAL